MFGNNPGGWGGGPPWRGGPPRFPPRGGFQRPPQMRQPQPWEGNRFQGSPRFGYNQNQPQRAPGPPRPAFQGPPGASSVPRPSAPKINVNPLEEPEIDDSKVTLDWYNSDLHMEIDRTDSCSVKAMSQEGFGYMWAGVRATYGVTQGRSCFEVSITNNQPADHLENEPNPHVLRCGWSTDISSLQLGTEHLSYGFGGTGKISTNNKFINYGTRFGLGDVVSCYLDMTNDPILISYAVNGNNLGIAFRVPKSELNGQALFPHVMTKNQDFLVNFGQLPGPLRPLVPGFMPIGQLEERDGLVRAAKGPASKSDCEVIQMVGLPGAGKTYWVNQHCRDNPEVKYNVLGTNTLIDKMKVMGLTRQRNYHGRWDALISKCTECFNAMLKIAKVRKRNYILDQTNVYPTARCKKMRDFQGFKCKTVVVVPKDEEFKRRCQARANEEGKEVPIEALLNMKANFVLPDVEETYGEFFYVELGPREANEVVQKYNQEALENGVEMTKGVKDFVRKNKNQRERRGIIEPIGKMWPCQRTETAAGPSRERSRSPINRRPQNEGYQPQSEGSQNRNYQPQNEGTQSRNHLPQSEGSQNRNYQPQNERTQPRNFHQSNDYQPRDYQDFGRNQPQSYQDFGGYERGNYQSFEGDRPRNYQQNDRNQSQNYHQQYERTQPQNYQQPQYERNQPRDFNPQNQYYQSNEPQQSISDRPDLFQRRADFSRNDPQQEDYGNYQQYSNRDRDRSPNRIREQEQQPGQFNNMRQRGPQNFRGGHRGRGYGGPRFPPRPPNHPGGQYHQPRW